MKKVFQGVNVNLQMLASQLFQWFSYKGYTSQFYGAGNYYIVQAKKEGMLRHLFAADRAFTVKLFGGQGYLEAETGVSNWVKAEDVTEAFLGDLILGPIGLLIEGAEGLWNLEIEHETLNEIERLVNSGAVSANPQFGYQYGYQQPAYGPYYAQPYQGYNQPYQGFSGARICRSCGFQNPPTARFCSNCGSPL
ncbi:zinc ribbon domain-containing protein [Stygiolobus caldivivus]|uniref:Zinc ribbon domain-containing protein n=1 Tax=Stygiolobus caldivivus TaxID=2824673 RepID=A0A8D5ZKA8_9CREN|nr:zinc ribbon domain-containing protein [Stygiolobus caldivivus]BCU71057.1 zinc ribbon domain-containing protein [Stygiolobus caldivivus]